MMDLQAISVTFLKVFRPLISLALLVAVVAAPSPYRWIALVVLLSSSLYQGVRIGWQAYKSGSVFGDEDKQFLREEKE